ncbi:MAG TPA: hypothetical protein VK629_16525, partial [Steroidobacteraceae bacterium]|nr:hypothetical protein [Steroidobacteraceae bacterium]
MSETLSVVSAILCEDVREEVSNKHTLVGVITGDILVGVFPGNIRVAAYIELAATKVGVHRFNLRFSYAGKNPLEMEGQINVLAPGLSAVALQMFTFKAIEAGTLTISVSTIEGSWIELIAREVRIGSA